MMNLSSVTVEVQLDRSCCYPFDGSSACPVGEDFQVDVTDEYTIYYTRCKEELCNNGKGDNSEDADNGGMCNANFPIIAITCIETLGNL